MDGWGQGLVLYLVRHGKTRRAHAGGAGTLGLSCEGWQQARAVQQYLSREPLERILCAPERRCAETMEPSARRRGLRVERLDAGLERAPRDLVRWLEREVRGRPAAVCVSAKWLEALIDGWGLERPSGAWGIGRKGSFWRLEGDFERGFKVEHRPPAKLASGASRLAVLDLGSRSFHLLVARVTADGQIEPVMRERCSLHLGQWSSPGVHIPASVCDDTARAVERMRERLREAKVDQPIVVGTAVFRDAANGPELAARLGRILGRPVTLLSGEAEAEAAFAALSEAFPASEGLTLGLDLGGGSLDLALGDALGVEWSASLPLGVVRLGATFPFEGADAGAEDEIRAYVRQQLQRVQPALAEKSLLRCLAAGGALRALARLVGPGRRASRRSIRGTRLCAAGLRATRRSVGRALKRGMSLPGIEASRAEGLPIATLVLEEVLAVSGLSELYVSDWGVREGLMLQQVRGLRPQEAFG